MKGLPIRYKQPVPLIFCDRPLIEIECLLLCSLRFGTLHLWVSENVVTEASGGIPSPKS
jgi:hypothetical protein